MEYDKREHYSKVLLDSFEELRRSGEYYDFEIKSGDIVVKAHRLVLAAASPYFAAMLRSGLAEARSGSVSLPTIAPDLLTALVDFMYTGKIHIGDKVQQLMIAADMLQLEDAVAACADHLKALLTPSNALNIFKFAEQMHRPALAEEVLRYVLQHWGAMVKEPEFLDLSLPVLIQLISSNAMAVKCESEVLHAALLWLDHDPEARAPHCLAVLHHVRLRLVPTDRLRKELEYVTNAHLREVLDHIVGALGSQEPRRWDDGKEEPPQEQLRQDEYSNLDLYLECRLGLNRYMEGYAQEHFPYWVPPLQWR